MYSHSCQQCPTSVYGYAASTTQWPKKKKKKKELAGFTMRGRHGDCKDVGDIETGCEDEEEVWLDEPQVGEGTPGQTAASYHQSDKH